MRQFRRLLALLMVSGMWTSSAAAFAQTAVEVPGETQTQTGVRPELGRNRDLLNSLFDGRSEANLQWRDLIRRKKTATNALLNAGAAEKPSLQSRVQELGQMDELLQDNVDTEAQLRAKLLELIPSYTMSSPLARNYVTLLRSRLSRLAESQYWLNAQMMKFRNGLPAQIGDINQLKSKQLVGSATVQQLNDAIEKFETDTLTYDQYFKVQEFAILQEVDQSLAAWKAIDSKLSSLPEGGEPSLVEMRLAHSAVTILGTPPKIVDAINDITKEFSEVTLDDATIHSLATEFRDVALAIPDSESADPQSLEEFSGKLSTKSEALRATAQDNTSGLAENLAAGNAMLASARSLTSAFFADWTQTVKATLVTGLGHLGSTIQATPAVVRSITAYRAPDEPPPGTLINGLNGTTYGFALGSWYEKQVGQDWAGVPQNALAILTADDAKRKTDLASAKSIVDQWLQMKRGYPTETELRALLFSIQSHDWNHLPYDQCIEMSLIANQIITALVTGRLPSQSSSSKLDDHAKLAFRFRPYMKFSFDDSPEPCRPCSWQWFTNHSDFLVPLAQWMKLPPDKRKNPNYRFTLQYPLLSAAMGGTIWASFIRVVDNAYKENILSAPNADVRTCTNPYKEYVLSPYERDQGGETWYEVIMRGAGLYAQVEDVDWRTVVLSYWTLHSENQANWLLHGLIGDHDGDITCVSVVYDRVTDKLTRVSYVMHGELVASFDLVDSGKQTPFNLIERSPSGPYFVPAAMLNVRDARNYRDSPWYDDDPDPVVFIVKDPITNAAEHVAIYYEWGTHEPWPNGSGSAITAPKHNGNDISFLPGRLRFVGSLASPNIYEEPFLFFNGHWGDPESPVFHMTCFYKDGYQHNFLKIPQEEFVDIDPFHDGELLWPPPTSSIKLKVNLSCSGNPAEQISIQCATAASSFDVKLTPGSNDSEEFEPTRHCRFIITSTGNDPGYKIEVARVDGNVSSNILIVAHHYAGEPEVRKVVGRASANTLPTTTPQTSIIDLDLNGNSPGDFK